MDNKITYLTTDLELQSPADVRPLFRAFEAAGMIGSAPTKNSGGMWFANLSMDRADEPEHNISAILPVIESLPQALKLIWNGCTLREFNIGYDCGQEPWAFNQGLSAALLSRIAAAGAALRITLYPNRDETGSCQAPRRNDATA